MVLNAVINAPIIVERGKEKKQGKERLYPTTVCEVCFMRIKLNYSDGKNT